MAVRPEKLVLGPDTAAPEPNGFAGEVADVGYLGDVTTFRVRLPSGMILRAARVNAEPGGSGAIVRGSRVAVKHTIEVLDEAYGGEAERR